jgi:hypothetical protein
LGVKPHLVITKNRTDVDTWVVTSDVLLGVDAYMYLNSTQARALIANIPAPTSTVLTLSPYNDGNGNGDAMIAYCWAPVSGYSSFGSYTGNGSADGPFVYTGFRPRWVMVKISSAASDGWTIQDSTRFASNPASDILVANSSGSESGFGGGFLIDFTSNGFKVRSTSSAHNSSGATYVWAAFAEAPFNYARAR